jgi:hypothetical protein
MGEIMVIHNLPSAVNGPNSRLSTSDVFSPNRSRDRAKQAKSPMPVANMIFGMIAGTTDPLISRRSLKKPSSFGFTIILARGSSRDYKD